VETHDRRFEPPHCPRPTCPHHRNPSGRWWTKAGHFDRLARPRRIRRFRCRTCGRWFSTQTFDTTYWLKRPDIQRTIFRRLVECSGFRQVARGLDVVHSTVLRQSERIGRHCLLFHWRQRPRELPDEGLVLDGLQTFEYSQYWPCDFNLLIGARSHYLHAFTDAELRRSGRMTPRQRGRRARLERLHGKPEPRATELEVHALLDLALPRGARVALDTDEHPAYPRALRRLRERDVEHRRTSSKAPRTPANPLWPANLADLLVRHSGGNHKRETIAFSKRRQSAAERLWAFLAWRNYLKPFSERAPRGPTPAQRAGVAAERLTVADLFHRRVFPSLVELPERLARYYVRDVATRQVPSGRRHALSYAF
jgi:transposase-like protein